MTDLSNLKSNAEHIALKPIYVSFEAPQAPPEFLGQYRETLHVEDVAEITGLSKQTIRTELEAGNIPGCRIGKQWVIPKPALVAFLYGRWM